MQRFTTSVFPSTDDDVVTSPYNALLSLARLAEHADCVLPVDNAALQGICCGPEGRARLLRPGIGAVGGCAGCFGSARQVALSCIELSQMRHVRRDRPALQLRWRKLELWR